MVKHDAFVGVLIGLILGLTFTSQLTPYLFVVVILAVLYGAKLIK